MNKSSLFLSVIFFFNFFCAQSQNDFIKKQNSTSVYDLQKSFDLWAKNKDLQNTKGWKWYKRWLNYNETRQNGKGDIVDYRTFINEAQKVSSLKNNISRRNLSSSTWLPVGPMSRPDTSPDFERGMGRINCVTFHPTDKNTYWVGVAQGGVWKTTNDGQSWIPLTDNLPVLRISDIAVNPKNTNEIYISVGDYAYLGVGLKEDNRKRNTHYGLGVYKTLDGGITWNPTGLTYNLTDYDASLIRRVFIHPDTTQNLVAAGIGGIWTSENSGQSWINVYPEVIWDIEQDPADYKILYASLGFIYNLQMGKAGIIKSVDFGKTWTLLNTGIPETDEVQRIELSISRTNPNYVYAIGCGIDRGLYGIWRTTDSGVNWELRCSSPNILEWNEGNGSGGQGTYDLVILADPADPETVYAGGVNLWKSIDGGTTWDGVSHWTNQYGPSTHADQHFLTYNMLDSTFYLCNDGGLYTTKNLEMGSWVDAKNTPGYQWPTQWEYKSDGMNVTSFYRLGLSYNNADYVISGAQDNGSFYKNNDVWLSVFGGDGMDCNIDPDNPEVIYGSYQYGNIMRSMDGGLSNSGQIGPWNVTGNTEQGEWTTPFIINPTNTSELLVGFGNLWKTDFSNHTPLSTFSADAQLGYPNLITAFTVFPSNSDIMYLTKRIYPAYNIKGEVWKTMDGGIIWEDVTAGLPDSLYFTSITIDDLNSEILWITCGGFLDGIKVFKTIDGGLSWNNITYNLPNIPVNCIAQQNDDTKNPVYIATDIGIYFINDDQNGWILYSDGLPNVIVTDLEIHYPTQKIYASTFGRGIWLNNLVDSNLVISGKEKFSNDLKVDLFPNPGNGIIKINIRSYNIPVTSIEIVDIAGRSVYFETVEKKGNISKILNYQLINGIYFLKIDQGSKLFSKKFIISNF